MRTPESQARAHLNEGPEQPRERMDASLDLDAEARQAELIVAANKKAEAEKAEISRLEANTAAMFNDLNREIDVRQDGAVVELPNSDLEDDETADMAAGDVLTDARETPAMKALEGKSDRELRAMRDSMPKRGFPSPWDKPKPEAYGVETSAPTMAELTGERGPNGQPVRVEAGADGVETSAPTMAELTGERPELAETDAEKKFFEEGEIMNSNADEYGRSGVAANRGYVERPGGDWVRGEGRHADMNEAARQADGIRKELEAAKAAYGKMPWYRRIFSRGEIKRLEENLSDAEDAVAKAKANLEDPDRVRKTQQLQRERRK